MTITTHPEQMDELARLLNGFAFSSLTIPGNHDTDGLVDRLLHTYFDT